MNIPQINWSHILQELGIDSISGTQNVDLKRAVLAENVKVGRLDCGAFEVVFDFLCPRCGKRHWAKEIDGAPLFTTVGWQLNCGWVSVRMPWTVTPDRDAKSVYGEPIRIGY